MAKIAVIPGDGIGVEVTREAVKVLRCAADPAALDLELETWTPGADRYLATGETITDEEMGRLQSEYDAILLGALGDPRVPDSVHAREILLGLRFRLDLYINLRPVRLIDGRIGPLKGIEAGGIDLVVFRENTEGIYTGVGGNFKAHTDDEVALEEDVNTRKGVERIVRAAFGHARATGRGRVTLADKANAMRHSGELWRRVFAEVAAEYPEVDDEAMYVDALALDLVRRPAHYEIIVTSNLFGDILSDLAAALVGGLGLAPSANLHPGRPGLFEPVHGSAPDLAGTNRANPLASILTGALMLRQLGYERESGWIERAVERTVRHGWTTPDLGGELGTEAVGDRVRDIVREVGTTEQEGE